MNNYSRIIVLLIAGCLLLTACGTPTQEPVNITGGGTAAMVNFPDDDKHTVSLNIGDTMVVNIPTIPNEGWDWVVQDMDTAILSQVGESIYKTEAGSNEAGGVVTLTFKAISPGTSILTLIYTNAPDPTSPDSMFSNSYGLTVNVK